jgi:hypothetical protein
MALGLDIGPIVLQFPSFWISEKRSGASLGTVPGYWAVVSPFDRRL